jgi:two-component system aerobic respiration control sensor histidine kinase ArcB
LLELITNALNFTEKGQVAVKIILAGQVRREVIIMIKVEDTGIGIPLDKQMDVLTRFKRIEPSYQGLYLGAGLGLSIIKELVDDIEGELYFESKEDEGSIFTCILCLKKAIIISPPEENSLAPIHEKAEPCASNSISHAPLSILLVEDNEIAAKVTHLLLTRLSNKVKVAKTGFDAIELAKKEQFDLILLDIGLPDISGFEVAKQIRQLENKSHQVSRIIALTAHVDKENQQKCLKVGIDEVLNKPLTEDFVKKMMS